MLLRTNPAYTMVRLASAGPSDRRDMLEIVHLPDNGRGCDLDFLLALYECAITMLHGEKSVTLFARFAAPGLILGSAPSFIRGR